MFNKKNQDPKLDVMIDRIMLEMENHEGTSEDFNRLMAQLERLTTLKEKNLHASVSPDTKAVIAANLAGILMIVSHERAHVVTSKAVNFLMKLR